MRFLKLLLSLLATGGLVYALTTSFTIKGNAAPAFGNLLNPFSGFWQNASGSTSASFDLKSGQISGLNAGVKVEFDDREVPHIFAENINDAVFIQGYLHAQNRLFQMDISTRKAAGRLSEIIANPKALESDMNERRYGMLWAAENALKAWQKDAASYKVLESYVAGVNAYIGSLEEKNYPVEYKILGCKPEPWTTLKTSLFFKTMCQMLARGDLDVDASNTLSILGKTDFDKLLPDICPDQKPIVPAGTRWDFKAATNAVPAAAPASFTSTYEVTNDVEHPEGVGSNNWVVGPKKTESGKPILCGDPHLGLTLPSIWYECQITTPEMNTYGVSLPGIPFVVTGFNNHIAWTQTNAMIDVAEWYKLKWKDDSHEQYELDGKWTNVTHKIEEYQVKGKGLVKDDVKYTKFGPVVVENNEKADNGLAFRWLCHDESQNDISVFYEIGKSKNADEFATALKKYAFPMQNYAFATASGDYGIFTRGRLPIMEKGSGRFVSDGTSSKSDWSGDVPMEQMPTVKNHPQGFVMSANQNQTDRTYPYDYHSYQFETVRSRYLQRKLEENKKFTFDDMKKLQNDVYSLDAEESLPVLLANIDTTQLSAAAKNLLPDLMAWKFDFVKESKAAMYYDIWIENFRKMTWDELQADNIKARYLKPKTWATIKMLKDNKDNKYFDIASTPDKENGKIIVTKSLNNVLDSIAKKVLVNLNPNMNYSDYKRTSLDHIAKMPGFGHENVAVGGNGQALNCMKSKHGPSWRMIVEPGENPKAFIVYPGGQTGNPGAKQFEQFIDSWANGEYYEAIYLKKASEGNARVTKTYEFSPK